MPCSRAGTFAVIVDKPPGQQLKQGEEVSHEEFLWPCQTDEIPTYYHTESLCCAHVIVVAQAPIRSRGGGGVRCQLSSDFAIS